MDEAVAEASREELQRSLYSVDEKIICGIYDTTLPITLNQSLNKASAHCYAVFPPQTSSSGTSCGRGRCLRC